MVFFPTWGTASHDGSIAILVSTAYQLSSRTMTHVVDVIPQRVTLDQVFKVQCGVIGRVEQYPTCDHLVFRVFGLSNIISALVPTFHLLRAYLELFCQLSTVSRVYKSLAHFRVK
jgi:hypothetical protein